MRGGCLANFFIIGAPKCGTSSLHFYLDQHPQISMSNVKEPCVFADPRWLPKHDDYEGMFDCDATRRGEASTAYTRFPIEGDAAPLIRAAVPHAKLLYLIRDPLERIRSDYLQLLSVGIERRDFNEALRDYSDPANIYVSASRYAMQIDRYLEHFDRSALLLLEQSDLRGRREQTLQRVFTFLDVDPAFSSRRFETEFFKREDYVGYQGVFDRLRSSMLGDAFRKLPARLRLRVSRRARRIFQRAPSTEIDPILRDELVDFLRPEVERVRSLTGQPLAGWLAADPVGSGAD
jgi:hypothetical protein